MKEASMPRTNAAIWLSPFAGAFAVALFLSMRAFTMPDRVGVLGAFVVWFIQRVAIGYICALPLLGIARWLGLRHVIGFMLLASLAAIPFEHHVATPINAWHPTAEELDHGFYWDAFIPTILLASITGAVFSLGLPRRKEPNQASQTTPGLRPSVSDL